MKIAKKILVTILLLCISVYTVSGQDEGVKDTSSQLSGTISHSAVRIDNGFKSYFINQSLIKHLPIRDIKEYSLLSPGSFYTSNSNLYLNGLEVDGDHIFIDGMQIRYGSAFPFRAIGEMAVFTSDAPLRLGNSVAGFVIIETLNPDSLFLSVDALSSHRIGALNDKVKFYSIGNSTIELNAGGPLRFGKNHKADKKAPSFYIAANLSTIDEQYPSYAKNYQVNEATLAELESNPLRSSGTGAGSMENAEFVTKDQFEETRFNSNAGIKALNAFLKINYPIAKKMEVSLGSYIQLDKRQIFIYENSIFNSKENPEKTTRNFDNYIKYSHELIDKKGHKLSYTMLINYSNYFNKLEHPKHKDDFFKYGYVGKFKTYTTNTYEFGVDSISGFGGFIHNGFADTLFTFEPSTVNQVASNYTSSYYGLYDDPSGHYENYNQVIGGGGLVNGYMPGDLSDNVYDLWYSPGKVYDQYGKTSQQQIRGKLEVDASAKNTRIKFGFEYSKRTERGYRAAPVGLWRQMRQLTNNHFLQLDKNNPQPVFTDLSSTPDPSDDTIYLGIVNYPRLYDGAAQSYFDYNLRSKLGMATNSTDWIDLNALPPETFSLGMFSPDELLNSGAGYVSYYGYDNQGNKLKSKPTLDDFFTQTISSSGYGGPTIYSRSVGAFEPVYINGYAQSCFSYKWWDLKIGMRIDHYDAKQQVLKDAYSLFEIRSAGQVPGSLNPNGSHPTGIDDDYAVYVDDIANPTNIVGYRDGDQWYDELGTELPNATALLSSSGIQPYLVDPSKTNAGKISSSGFEDYKAVINVLPSLSLKVRIYEHAQLFTHYNSYTQNPGSMSILRPEQYLFIQSYSFINNPALKPVRANKFKVGYRQIIFGNFWAEIYYHRDNYKGLPVLTKIENAFPISYYTYTNKYEKVNQGMTIALNYKSVKSSGLNAGASMNLQQGWWAGLASTAIYASVYTGYLQFNFGSGRDFVGINTKNGKRILQDLGLSLFFHYRNGTSYSGQRKVTQEGRIGGPSNAPMLGTIIGESMPNFGYINFKLEKGVTVLKGKMQVQFYAWMQNLLNQQNLYKVYAYTGDPSDDGYLIDPASQTAIASKNSEQSYRDLYTAKTDNPSHFDKPFILRLGTVLSF
ncbi:MAG: hypothetical protein COB85_08290 [Bacteroidetes bacterium]|nr:MAG: hypothetical protein COB85_08290 [Bacteroidota bacterium]